MFPLYLLAAEANLGLKRARECDDFLGLAGWLLLRHPEDETCGLRSQLARLLGQLKSMQGRYKEALEAFAEDAYYCSRQFGPEDVRTSLCYFSLGKVFAAMGERVNALAFNGKARARAQRSCITHALNVRACMLWTRQTEYAFVTLQVLAIWLVTLSYILVGRVPHQPRLDCGSEDLPTSLPISREQRLEARALNREPPRRGRGHS